MSNDILEQLSQTLEQRKQADPQTSYVARLHSKGQDAILKKVGEEATETIIASKGGLKNEIIYETAELWFHTLVMLSYHDLGPEDVLNELARRFDLSGIEEKANRKQGSKEK